MVGGILCPTPTGRKCLFVNIQMLEKIKTILSCTSLYYGSIYRWTDMKLENDVIGNGITENSGEDHKSIRKRVGGSLFRSRTVKTPVLSNIPPSSLKRFIPRKQLQTDIDTTHTHAHKDLDALVGIFLKSTQQAYAMSLTIIKNNRLYAGINKEKYSLPFQG